MSIFSPYTNDLYCILLNIFKRCITFARRGIVLLCRLCIAHNTTRYFRIYLFHLMLSTKRCLSFMFKLFTINDLFRRLCPHYAIASVIANNCAEQFTPFAIKYSPKAEIYGHLSPCDQSLLFLWIQCATLYSS